MKSLLITTALLEGMAGLAMAFAPSFVVSVLFGISMNDNGIDLMVRLTGATLLTLAIACWLSAKNAQSFVLAKTMTVYNILTIALLLYAVFDRGISGPGIWPAVVFHFGMLVWCLYRLRK